MFEYIKGKLVYTGVNLAVIETNSGIAFSVNSSANTLASLSDNQNILLYTHLIMREDGVNLYGFYTKEEREMFLRLISVSGVGAKVALSILCTLTVSDLAIAIITGDDKAFKRVSGVGVKTAARIILELREKIETPTFSGNAVLQDNENSASGEAVAALLALGYDKSEAALAVAKVSGLADTPNELILLALKRAGK